jgi:hypothetical protein
MNSLTLKQPRSARPAGREVQPSGAALSASRYTKGRVTTTATATYWKASNIDHTNTKTH